MRASSAASPRSLRRCLQVRRSMAHRLVAPGGAGAGVDAADVLEGVGRLPEPCISTDSPSRKSGMGDVSGAAALARREVVGGPARRGLLRGPARRSRPGTLLNARMRRSRSEGLNGRKRRTGRFTLSGSILKGEPGGLMRREEDRLQSWSPRAVGSGQSEGD